jgi:hypothetical protein
VSLAAQGGRRSSVRRRRCPPGRPRCDAKNAQVQRGEPSVSFRVGFASSGVHTSVHLHDQASRGAIEVDDEATDRDLRTKANPQPVTPQALPQLLLCRRRRPPHRPCPWPLKVPPGGICAPAHRRPYRRLRRSVACGARRYHAPPASPARRGAGGVEFCVRRAPLSRSPRLACEAGGRGGGVSSGRRTCVEVGGLQPWEGGLQPGEGGLQGGSL